MCSCLINQTHVKVTQSITRAVGTAGTDSSWPLVLKDKHKHKPRAALAPLPAGNTHLKMVAKAVTLQLQRQP